MSDAAKGWQVKKRILSRDNRRGYRYGICFHFGRRSFFIGVTRDEPTPELTPEQSVGFVGAEEDKSLFQSVIEKAQEVLMAQPTEFVAAPDEAATVDMLMTVLDKRD